jgi:hypothetical protein
MIIMSPFEGHAVIPKPPGFVEVILGVPGVRWALEDKRVVWSLTAAVVQLNKAGLSPREANLARVANVAGFAPGQMLSAILAVARNPSDPSQRELAAEFLAEYGRQ